MTKNIEWAKPDGKSLTMDIYVPNTGKSSYPVIIIYHGGGWLINTNAIMDSMSIYLVTHSEYIVCNVNYRLLGDNNNTVKMNQIIEDALGAVLWVKDNIARYKGDSSKIIVTGDSAGGHLTAMVTLCGNKLESDGFAGNSLGFNPAYLPKGKTAEDVAKGNLLSVQAAILSYPAVDIFETCQKGFEASTNFFWMFSKLTARSIFMDTINVSNSPQLYKAVSPIYNVPSASERILPPHLCMVGTNDNTTTPESVKKYVEKLKENGQQVEYWEYTNRPHAYLDSTKNPYLGTEFCKDAPVALDKMIIFLNSIFYAQ